MIVLALALVCWIVTTILVESEATRPLREWLTMQADTWTMLYDDGLVTGDVLRFDHTKEVFWRKLRYLVSCHLCAGTWVAFALVSIVPVHTFGRGFAGWLLGGLLVKAIAHLVLVAHKAGEAVAR